MISRKAFATLGLLLAFLIMLPVSRALETDRATKLTFSQSVQIPGRTLPAGTYWFVASTPMRQTGLNPHDYHCKRHSQQLHRMTNSRSCPASDSPRS